MPEVNLQTWITTIIGLMSAASLAWQGWRQFYVERDKVDHARQEAIFRAEEATDDEQRLIRTELRADVDRVRKETDILRAEVDQCRERANVLQRMVYELEQENRELKEQIRELKDMPRDRRRTDPPT